MKTEKSQYSEDLSNVMGESSGSSNPLAAIDSSNIGFQLLKKHGWKEGTGLGIAEQGILVPIQAEPKHNKQGLGSKKPAKRKAAAQPRVTDSEEVSKTTNKKLSKKLRKTIEHEKLSAEKEFERAFRMEFWPDNV
ncbi:PREDICTED: G patch domain and ankyrin repeat-containing protein 1 homolog [Camelina sativa]|uniref:G patch domain and ankyrin repeat-containing protein 1 homolog n=1 Tax=Camelina sativa TaxID=90675 RepID=A0ABM0YPE5_CAMSA|nr:PREDICTED: G patch domain and ankyrin repeat-containing protein 1 homolog [Camelina sativa]